MMKCKMKEILSGREEGAMAIESMIVLIFLIFFLVFLLGFGILFYQQWVVTFTANDTASRLSQSYAYPNTDPIMGYVSGEMKAALSPYRYITANLESGNQEKGEKYAAWCLERCSLAYPSGEPEIVVETVYDAFAQRHVVVDITATYDIPFGGALKFFGLDDQMTYHATGRAMCMDISDYINSVNTANSICGTSFNSKIYSLIDSVLSVINTLIDAAED